MLRRLYNWTLSLAGHRHAFWALGGVAGAESSFFPLPPDILLIPMVLANREKAYMLAGWCTITSVLGGVLGYAIGYFLYDTVGLWIMQLYGSGDAIETFRHAYNEYGAWIILLKGVTPIPYKVVTIASGFAGYDFWLFLILSLITRGIRFYVVTFLLVRYGEPIRAFIETRLEIATTIMLVVVIGGLIATKYLV
jgi:membrane protein YqaA with SNARE-associated domain